MTREEALRIVRKYNYVPEERAALETLIPELAESEDERIRMDIMEAVENWHPYERVEEIRAYLEKQKESLHISETYKENADSFIDDVRIRQMLIDHFTRYKIGNVSTKLNGFLIDDIITFIKNQKSPNARQKLAEWSKTEEGKAKYEAVAKEMREEMEKEQKPEDRFEEAREKYQVEWSEEDEKCYKELIHHFESLSDCLATEERHAEYRRWLSFLKSLRPSWKPSEEQMKILYGILVGCRGTWGKDTVTAMESLYQDLKKLM